MIHLAGYRLTSFESCGTHPYLVDVNLRFFHFKSFFGLPKQQSPHAEYC